MSIVGRYVIWRKGRWTGSRVLLSRATGPHRKRPPDLVLIGHVGFATDRTPNGTIAYTGGSGFAAAFAAAALIGDRAAWWRRWVRILTWTVSGTSVSIWRAPAVLPGASATFLIDQLPHRRLSFSSDLGVAADPRLDLFPVSYFQAKYVHVGSAPPQQQLAWLDFLRDKGCRARVSADMFEPIASKPDACRVICDRADLVYLNDTEYLGLYGGKSRPRAPTILKHGTGGRQFLADDVRPGARVDEANRVAAGDRSAGHFAPARRGVASGPGPGLCGGRGRISSVTDSG